MTTVASVGEKIAVMEDLSGNDNHWIQTSDSVRPTYTSSGSHKTCDFGDTGTFSLEFTSRIGAIRTVFFVVKGSTTTTDHTFILGDTSTFVCHGDATSKLFSSSANLSAVWLDDVKGAETAFNTPTVDFKAIAVTTTSNAFFSSFSRDRENAFGNRSWKGELILCFGYNVLLSDTDVSTINQEIKAYYSI